MGDVISISRVSDLDIISEFDAQCPAIPENIDSLIRQTAGSVLEKPLYNERAGSFRAACVAVVLLSIVALAGVKLVANQVADNYSSGRYNDVTVTGSRDWRKSKESWVAYIAHLENDPRVIHLRQEQKLFQDQYPN